jgi:hypothetical protein
LARARIEQATCAWIDFVANVIRSACPGVVTVHGETTNSGAEHDVSDDPLRRQTNGRELAVDAIASVRAGALSVFCVASASVLAPFRHARFDLAVCPEPIDWAIAEPRPIACSTSVAPARLASCPDVAVRSFVASWAAFAKISCVCLIASTESRGQAFEAVVAPAVFAPRPCGAIDSFVAPRAACSEDGECATHRRQQQKQQQRHLHFGREKCSCCVALCESVALFTALCF